MPPRRSHKKSRAGCKRCKSRKIKCDELHPRCGNCFKHGVPCDFECPEVADQLLAPAPSTPAVSSSSGTRSTLPSLDTTDSRTSQPSAPVSSPTHLATGSWSPQGADALLKTPLPVSSASATFYSAPGAATPPLVWPSPSFLPTTGIPPPLYSPSPSPSSLPPYQTMLPANRLVEMRLLHQYTTSTYETLPTEPTSTSTEVWRDLIPRAAFASTDAPYLADALLSVAAMHLRSIHPHDMDVVRACHTYMVSSIADYRAELARGIDDSNAEALFLTATLISFQSTASRCFLKDDAALDEDGDFEMDYFHPDQHYTDERATPASCDRTRSRYTLPLSWFHSFQGVKTIVATSWIKLRHSAAVQAIVESQPVLRLDLDAVTAALDDDTSSLASLSFFGHLLDGIGDELAVEDDEDVGLGSSTRQSYVHAVAVLNWAHTSSHRAAALAFPATVAKRFLDLVEARRPRALAILACFFALLKPLDETWWLKDVARREVMGIVSLFERGSPWWRHLEWPIRIALFEGSAIPQHIWGADYAAEERRLSLLKIEQGDVASVVDHIEMFTQAQAASVALGYAPI